MGFLKKLASIFSPASSGASRQVYPLSVSCQHCGELIQSDINLANDLSIDYGEDGEGSGPVSYICRKVLVGQQRCFQPIEVVLRFNASRQVIDRQISGGSFTDD